MGRPTLSPDGRTRIEWGYTDGRMSHEIWAPRITDAETGEVVLDLWVKYMWDAWVEWLENGVMRLAIREYLDGGTTILYVDVDRGSGTFWVDGGKAQPIAGIQKEVEVAFWKKAKKDHGM
ncbi:MAG: hypothetical protein JST93_06860 [Acidobacteria bacterium]|nr:hypothetical protein [Acidobacteriota bacterium]